MPAMSHRKLSTSILSVQNLSIRRGKVRILKDIDWRVEEGQHWVILGSNGSGKTSLLAALTGYLPPTDGDIHLLGQRFGAADWRELRRSVGMVSSSIRALMAESELALDTVISGKYAIIDFWGKPSAQDHRERMRILRQVECRYLADRPWAYLSQGERQRVLIGRALMAKPRLLILDEPCAGLDPVAREHFLQWLNRLGRQSGSPTLVFVTHHVEEIMPVFSHALVLRKGSILTADKRQNVLRSALLSEAFGAKVKLVKEKGRYGLKVSSADKSMV
jgi:iron complex transport system ATP-binding protein